MVEASHITAVRIAKDEKRGVSEKQGTSALTAEMNQLPL